MAQEIAQRDQITEGLVCIFAVLEVCSSFAVIGNRKTHRLEVVRRKRKCLHLYWYLIDPEFGWMHAAEAKGRIHRTSRLIAKCLYRVSHHGVRTMWAAVRLHDVDFPPLSICRKHSRSRDNC